MKGYSLSLDALPKRASPSLDVAFFGKHPAWDDHMETLGTETASIRALYQFLYLEGIGENLHRGAWQALFSANTALPFDHEFMWCQGDLGILGLLIDSKDARGRGYYPLVAACHARGYLLSTITPAVLSTLQEGLGKLHAVTDRDLAQRLAQGLQGKMRTLTPSGLSITEQEREAFLNMPEMGPRKQGFQRIIHIALAASEYTQQTHLLVRVPTGEYDTARALLLWRGFFQSIYHQEVSLFLLKHKASGFLDIIVGTATSDDFICLHAGLDTMSLSSDAPYQLSDALGKRAEEIFTAYISGISPKPADKATSGITGIFRRLKKV